MSFKQPAKPADTAPRTRKELLHYLWNEGVMANVFKEGPLYAVQLNKTVAATRVRSIQAFSFAEWKRRIVDLNFPL